MKIILIQDWNRQYLRSASYPHQHYQLKLLCVLLAFCWRRFKSMPKLTGGKETEIG
ncbi:MAG: hypothetical protein LUH15_16795 [Tannerellaceae bacterium]|nr:hypothetical protein [Tannerellaceae bacterium]